VPPNQAHLVVQRIQEEQHLKSSLKEKDKEIDSLHDIVINLEVRLEHQEQYSRRTSLRFHNIDVPVDDRGHIIHPVITDDIIVDICNNKLKLDISTNDISRSHVIGKVRNGKSQVIVRFLSYRCREKVYNSKRNLKNDADRIFITENLTKTRTNRINLVFFSLIYIIVRGIAYRVLMSSWFRMSVRLLLSLSFA
jgi:hypothetical protein